LEFAIVLLNSSTSQRFQPVRASTASASFFSLALSYFCFETASFAACTLTFESAADAVDFAFKAAAGTFAFEGAADAVDARGFGWILFLHVDLFDEDESDDEIDVPLLRRTALMLHPIRAVGITTKQQVRQIFVRNPYFTIWRLLRR
jgi:hypothetical protein